MSRESAAVNYATRQRWHRVAHGCGCPTCAGSTGFAASILTTDEGRVVVNADGSVLTGHPHDVLRGEP